MSNGFIYKISNGVVDYSTLDSYAGSRSGTLTIPQTKNGVDLKTINASFTWTSFSKIVIPSTVTSIVSNSQIFCKTNVNNTALKTIVNKTGREFDWYYLTCSSHPKHAAKFATGVVSHQSGDITISAN
jgi:hypothetical protein